MKILFIIPSMSSGGAERIVSILSERFTIHHSVEIYTLEQGASFYNLSSSIILRSAEMRVNRNSHLTMVFTTLFQLLFAYRKFRKECKYYKPDVVISFLPQAAAIAHFARVGTLNYAHISSERNDPTQRKSIMKGILKHIYSKVDCLVCQSKSVADFYGSCVKERIKIIPNPINISNIPVAVEERKPARIVAVGRLDGQKNFMLLINAFKTALDRLDTETTLTIYGEGKYWKELDDKVSELKLQNKVFLPGACKNIFDQIKDAALFVMSSDYEGFPNALLEAMAVGLPVISTDFPTGVARELIDADNGIIVPVGDTQAMAKAIVSIMTDKDLRISIRKNNRIKARAYDIKDIVELWEQVVLFHDRG